MTDSSLLDLVQVRKDFGSFRALDDVDLQIRSGSVTCIVGPSGSGKSTLLRTLNLLESIDGGGIFLRGELLGHRIRNGHRIHVSRRTARRQALHFGMVFQQFNLFPNYTALQNVTIAPILVQKIRRDTARAAGRSVLEQVGLADKADAYPAELSGGQQQRVAIARALAMEPEILLFDEPTSALDPELVGEVLGVMRSLATAGSTMVVVTHEMRFAEDVADEIVMMDEGQIVERGDPRSVLYQSSSFRARQFFASIGADKQTSHLSKTGAKN